MKLTMPPLLLVAAATQSRVRAVAQVRGINPERALMVNGSDVIEQHPSVPLIIDPSWSGHPMHRSLQGVLGDAIVARIGRESNRRGDRHRA